MAAHPRPLSPHLQVYRQPLTAGAMSIFHRITGVALALGAFALVAWLLAAAGDAQAYARFAAIAGAWPGIVAITLATFSLVYHLLNGIRHLFWDVGMGFDGARGKQSGVAVLVLTVAITAGLVFLAGQHAGALA